MVWMNFLIDTNICIYIINHHPPEVIQKFRGMAVGDVGISSITVSELQYGVAKSNRKKENQDRLAQFLMPFEILPFDEKASSYYGEIRAQLEQQGAIIGSLDLLIAAHALSLQVVLITNNEKEFKRIPSLKIKNWVV